MRVFFAAQRQPEIGCTNACRNDSGWHAGLSGAECSGSCVTEIQKVGGLGVRSIAWFVR